MSFGDYGGGGYMQESSQQPDGAVKKRMGERGLLPVTVKQIMESKTEGDDNEFVIDDREAKQITIVGQITDLQTQSMNYCYVIEDSTGSVEAISWLDQDEAEFVTQQRATLQPGKYVRVVGAIKQNPKDPSRKFINAFNMRVIEDFNEITYHFLDAIHSHLYNTRGPKSAPPAGASNFASPGKPSAGAGIAAAGASAAAAAYSAPAAGAGSTSSLLDMVQLAFDTIQGDESTGISVDTVTSFCSQQMGRAVSKGDVMKACETISLEGRIYSTIDEEHFCKI